MLFRSLFSLFPSNWSKNHGEVKRRQALRRTTMGVKHKIKSWGTFGDEDPLNMSSENLPVMHKNALDRRPRRKFLASFQTGHQRYTPHLAQLKIFRPETSVWRFWSSPETPMCLHLRPRPTQNFRNTNTKNAIPFAYELCFQCSWPRCNHHNEIYKIQRNIIAKQGRIKPNG